VKEGYIVEFANECNESFNNAKRKIATSHIKKLLEESPLCINMLFMEKSLICMDSDRMDE
jgi:hypothetical protein